MNATTNTTPRVWLACLASYNAGRLHGAWVDATDADELHEAAQKVLRTSGEPGAEEIAVHDYDGFGDLGDTLGEYPSFDQLAAFGALIEEHGERFLAFLSATDFVTSEYERAESVFEDTYCGEFSSERDYAYEYVEEGCMGEIPEHLSAYLDYDAIARDLFQYGECVFVNGYVFDMGRI